MYIIIVTYLYFTTFNTNLMNIHIIILNLNCCLVFFMGGGGKCRGRGKHLQPKMSGRANVRMPYIIGCCVCYSEYLSKDKICHFIYLYRDILEASKYNMSKNMFENLREYDVANTILIYKLS